jgi:hypothetical protein
MRFSDASRWVRCSALGAFFVFAGGCSSLPDSAVGVLESADQFQIFALEPYGANEPKPTDTVFQGHVVLAQADVKDPKMQEKIAFIVDRGVRQGGSQAKCFNPRHGVHATKGKRTVDLVICYECSAVEVVEDGNTTTLTTGNVQSDLDDAFRVAGVTRPQ